MFQAMKHHAQAAPLLRHGLNCLPQTKTFLFALLTSAMTACTPSTPPESAAEPPNSDTVEPTPALVTTPEPAEADPPSADGQSDQPAAPSEPSPITQISQACESNCQRMDAACRRSAEFCRSSCRDYVAGAEKCPVEIYAALTCQSNAEDFLLCSNVSPEECATVVRAMQNCQNGTATPAVWGEKKQEESSAGPPAGWVRLAHPRLGFSILFPPGASWSQVGENEVASVRSDELNYRATIRSLAGKKINESLILRTVVSELGKTCEADIRLHGRYETQGTTHIRFNSSCKGQENYYGILHIKGEMALLLSIHRQGQDDAPLEHLESLVFGYDAP